MISPALLWDEITEWSELIFWAGIGAAFGLSVLVAVLYAAWHVIWWVMVGAV